MTFSANMVGFAELDAAFDELGNFVEDDVVMHEILEPAGFLLAEAMRQNIQGYSAIDTGALYESTFHHVYSINGEDCSYGFNAGTYKTGLYDVTKGNVGGKKPPTEATVGYWLEYGTQPHYTGSGSNMDVKNREGTGLFNNGIKPRPYVSTAWNAKRETAYQTVAKGLGKEIDKV